MGSQIYTFRIAYKGFETKIWRIAEVSGNYSLAQLGYLVLATFDTLAYHLFEFTVKGTRYSLKWLIDNEFDDSDVLYANIKLSRLDLSVGDKFEMEYDFGCSQIFTFRLLGISDMPSGTSSYYPHIKDGKGRGIIDDVDVYDFGIIVKEIDETGKQKHLNELYRDDEIDWDYREFDLELENRALKRIITKIRNAYENCPLEK